MTMEDTLDTEKRFADLLRAQFTLIGEDPDRSGLADTPARVMRAWKEIFQGYNIDPRQYVRRFEAGEGYNEIIVLRDIEIYACCEHHMLPFFGRAHVAYLPGPGLLGVSKLARIVDAFSRRLQIQERIGRQVTQFLMKEVEAQGAACIIEAEHLCMRMRGVGKQNSVMVTSSMEGVFLNDQGARSELMSLLRGTKA